MYGADLFLCLFSSYRLSSLVTRLPPLASHLSREVGDQSLPSLLSGAGYLHTALSLASFTSWSDALDPLACVTASWFHAAPASILRHSASQALQALQVAS